MAASSLRERLNGKSKPFNYVGAGANVPVPIVKTELDPSHAAAIAVVEFCGCVNGGLWLCTCTTCKQSLGTVEKDLLPEETKLLSWHKKNQCKKCGLFRPTGNECYHCFGTRRRYCKTPDGRIKSQEEVNADMNLSKENTDKH